MEQKKLDRINELTKLSRERELTEAETAERAELRKEYIADWRRATIETLESTYIQEPDGTTHPLKKRS